MCLCTDVHYLPGNKAKLQAMRLVYLDESGTGDASVEPNVFVAGVAVDADSQWKMLERYLHDMATDFALPADRPGFVFHAQELVNGGKVVSREKYPRAKREYFLRSLCEIPEVFGLPLVCHAVSRANIRKRRPGVSEDGIVLECLLHASIACAHGVEQFLTKHGRDGEVALMVYESNGQKSSAIRDYHNLFRSEDLSRYLDEKGLRNLIKFERIIDTAHFATKTDSSILQVADACAYVLARLMRGRSQPEDWHRPLLRCLFFGPTALAAQAEAARRANL